MLEVKAVEQAKWSWMIT